MSLIYSATGKTMNTWHVSNLGAGSLVRVWEKFFAAEPPMGQTHRETEKRLYLSFHQSLALQSNCCFQHIIYYSEIYRTSASQIKKTWTIYCTLKTYHQFNVQPIFRSQFHNFNISLGKILPFRFFWFRLNPTYNRYSVFLSSNIPDIFKVFTELPCRTLDKR